MADFGCGDAQIAAEVKQKVHSFDLVATVPGARRAFVQGRLIPEGRCRKMISNFAHIIVCLYIKF